MRKISMVVMIDKIDRHLALQNVKNFLDYGAIAVSQARVM
jgi:hypothetical protein